MKIWYSVLAAGAFVAVIYVSFPNKANAQVSIITGGFNEPIGESYTTGHTTIISNKYGAPIETITTIRGASPTQPIVPLPILALPPLR